MKPKCIYKDEATPDQHYLILKENGWTLREDRRNIPEHIINKYKGQNCYWVDGKDGDFEFIEKQVIWI